MIPGHGVELELLVKLFNWELMGNIGRIRLEGVTMDLEEVVCYGNLLCRLRGKNRCKVAWYKGKRDEMIMTGVSYFDYNI